MKRLLIVGGTKGIGYSVAKQMARKHLVYIAGREKPIDSIRGISFVPIDFLNPETVSGAIRSLVAQGEKINYLLFFQRFRGNQELWDSEMQVSLTATKQMIEHLSDQFDSKEASIVLVASVNSAMISSHLPAEGNQSQFAFSRHDYERGEQEAAFAKQSFGSILCRTSSFATNGHC